MMKYGMDARWIGAREQTMFAINFLNWGPAQNPELTFPVCIIEGGESRENLEPLLKEELNHDLRALKQNGFTCQGLSFTSVDLYCCPDLKSQWCLFGKSGYHDKNNE